MAMVRGLMGDDARVAFIGLGRMGEGMAAQLLGSGYPLVVHNRTPQRAEKLAAEGAEIAASTATACSRSRIVVTMLSDDQALAEVALGEHGVAESLEAGGLHIAMGTHGVPVIRRVHDAHVERGQLFLAAPVFGRPDAARAGKVRVVAAGPRAAFELGLPVLEAMAASVTDAGDSPEAATSIKLINNFLLGCAVEALAEAFSLARRHGVEPKALFDVLAGGGFMAGANRTYAELMVGDQFDNPGFSAELALKDVTLVLAAGERARVPLPSAAVVRDRLLGAIAHGDGDQDLAVLAREQARAAGLA